MSGLRAVLIAAFCLSMFVQDALAQPRAGLGDRDRDRGLLGRVGARRDERLNRNSPAPPPGRNPNAPLNPNGVNPGLAAARTPNPAGANATGAANPNANPLSGANPYGRVPLNNTVGGTAGRAPLAPTPAPALQTNQPQSLQRSANYPPSTSDVRTASGSAPINKLPYSGPGVLIRLPATIPGEVNYLVDDSEHLIVHSGEDQLLRLKGSYEVRFSRGVTDEGRSYGEARYTITEGVYRFDVGANGWELYREGEARDVERAVAEARQRADDARRQDELAATSEKAQPTTSLPPLMAPRDTQLRRDAGRGESSNATSANERSLSAPPSPAPPSPAPSAAEETLPAPKSILEPT